MTITVEPYDLRDLQGLVANLRADLAQERTRREAAEKSEAELFERVGHHCDGSGRKPCSNPDHEPDGRIMSLPGPGFREIECPGCGYSGEEKCDGCPACEGQARAEKAEAERDEARVKAARYEERYDNMRTSSERVWNEALAEQREEIAAMVREQQAKHVRMDIDGEPDQAMHAGAACALSDLHRRISADPAPSDPEPCATCGGDDGHPRCDCECTGDDYDHDNPNCDVCSHNKPCPDCGGDDE